MFTLTPSSTLLSDCAFIPLSIVWSQFLHKGWRCLVLFKLSDNKIQSTSLNYRSHFKPLILTQARRTMSLLENTKHDIYPFISPTSGLASAFAGKAILITGAGTGIGRATALTFAHAGASRIIVAGRRLAPLEECKAAIEKAAKGCEVTVAADTDVADEGAVKRLFEKAGSVDVLVNNAATVGVRGLDSEEVGLWWQEIVSEMWELAAMPCNC